MNGSHALGCPRGILTDRKSYPLSTMLPLFGLTPRPNLRPWWILPLLSLGTIASPRPIAAQTPTPLNPTIEVGIVQRFGTESDDRLTIEALGGDQLTLAFETGGQPQTVTAQRVVMDVQMQTLTEPEARERVVLSTHRSFESAEDSALQWQARGIETELAQPGTWEVWAKREIYHTPLLRRILVRNLEQQGFTLPYLDSTVVQEVPRLSWVVNGYRYTRDRLDITTTYNRAYINNSLHPGGFHWQPNSYGTYTLVNAVKIEDYLRGVVPHEIGPAAPQSAVEAQAVLARTYALRNLRRFTIDDYELCADTQCQVYWGWRGTVDRVDRAIEATRGLVLTYDNTLVDAVYYSTSGGVTAAFEEVWDGEPRPYLQPVVDTAAPIWDLNQRPLTNEQNFRSFISLKDGFNEVGWRYFRWQVEGSLATLTQDLRTFLQSKQHSYANFQTIQNLAVTQRGRSGRVQQLRVTTDRGPVILEKDEILRAFSPPISILFYLDPKSDATGALTGYTFTGGGWGHGVGLSQAGSYNLADLGWSSRQILNFYYPQTQLQPLTDAITFWRP